MRQMEIELMLKVYIDPKKLSLVSSEGKHQKYSDFEDEELLILLQKGDVLLDPKQALANGVVADTTVMSASVAFD